MVNKPKVLPTPMMNSAAIIQWPGTGAIAFKCHHDGCADKDWPALQQLWQLTSRGGISAADIVLPSPQFAPVNSHTSHNSLETYISTPVLEEAAFYGNQDLQAIWNSIALLDELYRAIEGLYDGNINGVLGFINSAFENPQVIWNYFD